MRITGGQYGGRLLESPADRTIRPTSDKVRAAIFNILNARGLVAEAVVLDAFCGTGALGIESLSWRSSCCTFIDKNRRSLSLCQQNFAALKVEGKHNFFLKDATKPGGNPNPDNVANLVFLDPPYAQQLVESCLPPLTASGWIAQDAWILAETEKAWSPSVLSSMDYDIALSRDYGDTRITLAKKTVKDKKTS